MTIEDRNTVFFINGGAGRVLCSIPALELFAKENPSNDFIIVSESGLDFYKGHPILHERAYDINHKDLFKHYIKHRNIATPEPYRVYEYYNQLCSLSQAFDIEINKKGIRDVGNPQLYLDGNEYFGGIELVREVKEKTNKNKIIVIQPFGRGSQTIGTIRHDQSGRSLSTLDTLKIIKKLQKDFGVILMSEFPIEQDKNTDLFAMPLNISLRQWAGIISECDYFVGIDSVGQHLANSLDKYSTVLIGATYPINITYPQNNKFNIIDLGEDRRKYDPIRISFDDVSFRNNENIMQLDDDVINLIVDSIVHTQKEITR